MERNSDKLGAPRVTPAMWEQRRYEIARDIYTNENHSVVTAEYAVRKADRLIEELKKPKQ
jgi:hypothetical protein